MTQQRPEAFLLLTIGLMIIVPIVNYVLGFFLYKRRKWKDLLKHAFDLGLNQQVLNVIELSQRKQKKLEKSWKKGLEIAIWKTAQSEMYKSKIKAISSNLSEGNMSGALTILEKENSK